jgi:poly [ADP-ribose] polymerase 6/8
MSESSELEEEVIIDGDPDESEIEFDCGPSSDTRLRDMIAVCTAYFPWIQFTQFGSTDFEIVIPTSVLPRHLAIVNRFHESPTLLIGRFSLGDSSFRIPCRSITWTNPIHGSLFPGRCLLSSQIASFFSMFFRPPTLYRCQSIFFEHGEIDSLHLQVLCNEGYDERAAIEALSLTFDNLQGAREYLFTGAILCNTPLTDVSYQDCPLLYLILEIVESFFRLLDHCSVCGKELGISGVKPSLCDSPVCFFSVTEIGLHSSVVNELRRDPLVADFLICLASAAYDTKFFVPPLPIQLVSHGIKFFKCLPSISTMSVCENDSALRELIGNESYEILRFILNSNRTHLVRLPDRLKLRTCANVTEQLLCVAAAPEKELTFRRKKGDSKSAWLWHGSTATRWYAILHTGLQDLGKSPDRTHAGADTFGPGVYQSQYSQVSIGYSQSGGRVDAKNTHGYEKSTLPQPLIVLALVENLEGPLLKKVAAAEWTQRDLDGLIVRCLMIVKQQFQWDVQTEPPKRIPTLEEYLEWIEKNESKN